MLGDSELIISLSGIDGSGKTTLAREIKKMLIQAGVDVQYRHEYNYIILRYLFKIAGNTRLDANRKAFLSSDPTKPKLYKLWPYFVFLDAIFLILWLKMAKRKSIMILDRYLYDQLISFRGLGVANKFVEWLYLRAPRPDIVIFLSVLPKKAYDRKKNTHSFDLNFYEIGNNHYHQMARQLQLSEVNTDFQLSGVFKQILYSLFSNEKFKNHVISKAANNRVIYKLFHEFKMEGLHFEVVKKTYDRKVAILQKTLDFIETEMIEAKIEWLLYKSYMPFPYVPTYDVDILVRPSDRKGLLEHLQKKGIPNEEEEQGKINVRLKNFYPVSIHFGVSWEGIDYVSTSTMWRDTRKVIWHGRSVRILNREAEILSHIAHIFFELSFIRLSDALYLSELMKSKVDWGNLIIETERNNWSNAFLLVVQLVRRISAKLGSGIQLPYPVPYIRIVTIFIGIMRNDQKKKNLSITKIREYAREIVRYAFWRIGARVLGRAPFGEILGL